MKTALLILLTAAATATAEGVHAGAPNPGWVRHGTGGPTGLQLLAAIGAVAAALALVLLPWRQRPIGPRPALSRADAVTPAYLLPTIALLALGLTLVLLKQGDVAALASVFFSTVTGMVALHLGADLLDRWREQARIGLAVEKAELLDLALLVLGEVVAVGVLLFLLSFLPQDCAALGLMMFALGQALVVHAHAGRPGSFRSRLLLGNLRGNSVLLAFVFLMQTAFEPTSIEAIGLVEFLLALRLTVPAAVFLAARFGEPAMVGGLTEQEAIEMRRWLRCAAAVTAMCGTALLLLDRFRLTGFFIHRDFWWTLPLPVCAGLIARLFRPVSTALSGLPLLGGFLVVRSVFELPPMQVLVGKSHDAMAWSLALVLLAWGWWLGDHQQDRCARPEPSSRPEPEALVLAVAALVLVLDWFDAPRPRLSLLDFKVVTGVLLGILLHRAFPATSGDGSLATWRLPALSFVFPVVGIATGLPLISVFAFVAAVLVMTSIRCLTAEGGCVTARIRLHFAVTASLPGLAIAVEVLRSLGNSGHALPIRLTLAAVSIVGGMFLGLLCQRVADKARQALK